MKTGIEELPYSNQILVAGYRVIGYNHDLRSPLLCTVTGMEITMHQVRKASWDAGDNDAFTQDQIDQIESTVSRLKNGD